MQKRPYRLCSLGIAESSPCICVRNVWARLMEVGMHGMTEDECYGLCCLKWMLQVATRRELEIM